MRTLSNAAWITVCLAAGLAVTAQTGASYGQDATDELIGQGRVIYEETAGGVGCSVCHGMEATGDPDAGGPYIRGVLRSTFDAALNGAVREMEFLNLAVPEREAVFAYLGYLATAEEVTLDPVAEAGKVIFEETAGGVGCASCHGQDAAGQLGPNIIGKDSVAILEQLRNNEQMRFIELSQEEVDQVAAYLRHLHDLEAH